MLGTGFVVAVWCVDGEQRVRPGSCRLTSRASTAIRQLIDEVVAAGLWTVVEGGYRMEFGPSSDWPLPIWRYSTD